MAARRAAAILTGAAEATPFLLAATATATTSPLAATPLSSGLRSAAIHGISTSSGASILRSAAATAILSRRAVSLPHAAGFSSNLVLGSRNSTTAILPSATALVGSRNLWYNMARRGCSTANLSPELKEELRRMEEASMARQMELLNKFETFQAKTRKDYVDLAVSRADAVLHNAKVGWNVVWGSLAAAALGLWLVLLTKSLWIQEFKVKVLTMLTDMLVKLLVDLEERVKQIVREELDKEE